MHIITMTKQHPNASSGPAPQGDGAPDLPFPGIVSQGQGDKFRELILGDGFDLVEVFNWEALFDQAFPKRRK